MVESQARARDQAPWSWLREESFWRSITETAVGGAIVALLIFLVGWATGIFATPTALLVLYIVGCAALVLTSAILYVLFVFPMFRNIWLKIALSVAMGALIGMVMWIAILAGHVFFA